MVSKSNMVTKEEFLQKFVAKDVIKNKLITVAGQMIFEYEKELGNSNPIIKGYEDYIGDNKIEKHILEKVCGDNVKDICSEKDEIYKKNLSTDLLKL